MKQINVVVNGEPKVAENRDYTFQEIIILAFGSYDDSQHDYTVILGSEPVKHHFISFSPTCSIVAPRIQISIEFADELDLYIFKIYLLLIQIEFLSIIIFHQLGAASLLCSDTIMS